MMQVTRTFHPVGHGSFNTEEFHGIYDNKKHIVVYDCGSGNQLKQTNRKLKIENYLENDFLKSNDISQTVIDAVFVSHLHADHINGLPYLLNKANVRRIFLPQLTPNGIVESVIYNVAFIGKSKGKEANQFILELLNSSYNSHIVEVFPRKEGDEYDVTPYYLNDESSNNINEIVSGTQVFIGNAPRNIGRELDTLDKWVYIPFCSEDKNLHFDLDGATSEIKNIITELKEKYNKFYESGFGEDIKVWYKQCTEELVKFITSQRLEELKDVYTRIFSKISNVQTMTLFSGLLQRRNVDVISNIYPYFGKCTYVKYYQEHKYFYPFYAEFLGKTRYRNICNFLYTGDYNVQDAKRFKEMKSCYESLCVWEKIYGVQIPHHGSKDNFNAKLYTGCGYAVISSESKTRVSKRRETLFNVFLEHCYPHVVTDDINSLLSQSFYI